MKTTKPQQACEQLTNLFDEKTERRLHAAARSAYNESPYGHGKWDAQSAEVSVAEEIQKLGTHSDEDSYEIAREIAARVVSQIDEERAAIYEEEEARIANLRAREE